MSFQLLDLALAAVAGVLLGLLAAGWRRRDPKNRPIARLMALVLEPLYYWLDLYSPSPDPEHRQPSHRKVTFVVAAVAMLGIAGTAVVRDLLPDGSLSLNTVLLCGLVMLFNLGPAAYNGFVTQALREKLGDVVTARTSRAYHRPTPPGMDGPDLEHPWTREAASE